MRGFEEAIARCADANMALFAAAANLRGDRTAEATMTWMREERIAAPDGLVAMLAPG